MNEDAPCEVDNRPIEIGNNDNIDVITEEGKSAVMELVAGEMARMVEEVLHGFLRKTLHDAQSRVQSVLYNFVEQMMLDLLCKDFIGETLNEHTAKYCIIYIQLLRGFRRVS